MTGSPNTDQSPATSFRQRWFDRGNLTRAVKVSLTVGTALVIINQGDQFLAGIMPPIWKILLTYLVPYLVSSYAGAQAARSG